MINKSKLRFLHNVHNFFRDPLHFLGSYQERDLYKKIWCVMCGYNEHENVELAIESVIGVADVLVFIDKNGVLEGLVKQYKSQIEIIYRVEKSLNLLESREYAISMVPLYCWVLIVDADEVMQVDRSYLTPLQSYRACYRTSMTISHRLFDGVYAMNDYHPFFLYNNGKIYFAPPKDVPRYKGRYINLDVVCKENRAWCKNKRHQYYRATYWKGWQFSEYKAEPIETYIISEKGAIPSDAFIDEWYDWITSRGIRLGKQ